MQMTGLGWKWTRLPEQGQQHGARRQQPAHNLEAHVAHWQACQPPDEERASGHGAPVPCI